MKVQINLKTASKTEATSTFDLTVNAEDTVLSAKERIAAAQLVAFPDQDLLCDGEILEASKKLSECGVKEGSSLDFVVRASESSLVKQLTELLQARDLSSDELGLLYCYKHGVSISQALKTLGREGKFVDFLKEQKPFFVENGLVSLVRADTALKPFSPKDEVKQILEAAGGSLEIPTVCSKFVQKFNTSLASIVGMPPAKFLEKERDLFVVTGRGIVSLKSATPASAPGLAPASPPGLDGARRDGTPPWNRRHPEHTPQTSPKSSSVCVAPASQCDAPDSVDSQQYLELHNKISGRSFNSKIAQILTEFVVVLCEQLFLNVDHVVKGGSVGKGTAITGVADAEVVLFLAAMPAASMGKWLPPLLKAAAATLTEHLTSSQHGTGEVRITSDSVQVTVKGIVNVDIRFSPMLASHGEAIETMRSQGPAERRLLSSSLAQEKTQFIAKQPGQVKVTMRLLKWWREQQRWSSTMARPSDEILELVAVYSAVQTKPADQRSAIANAMSLMARFDELRIVWSNYYEKQDIWAPLLHQRPLLMDPTNPFVNVADPQVFDARELMSLASTTHFFW